MILDEGYFRNKVPLWPWSHGSWIYNYLCKQCLSPLILWVQISIWARCTILFDKVCRWLATGRWFSRGSPVPSINETDHHDITELLLKVASVLLVEQTGVRGNNHWPVGSHRKLYQIMLYRVELMITYIIIIINILFLWIHLYDY